LQKYYQQGRMAVVSNVGMLVRPTSTRTFNPTTNCRPTCARIRISAADADRLSQRFPAAALGGRTADLMQTANAWHELSGIDFR